MSYLLTRKPILYWLPAGTEVILLQITFPQKRIKRIRKDLCCRSTHWTDLCNCRSQYLARSNKIQFSQLGKAVHLKTVITFYVILYYVLTIHVICVNKTPVINVAGGNSI